MYFSKSKLLKPLHSSDKIHQVLHKVFLPGAGAPIVVPAPDEVDDRGEAGAADGVKVHGQVEVPGPHPPPPGCPPAHPGTRPAGYRR